MSLLPIELYRPIIEEVSRNDLFSFLRVSPPFRLEAERHIYRKLSLGPADDVVLRCHFLILNPRILVHSQTLDIRLEAWKKGTSKRHPYHRLLAAVLEQAINLKSLTIRGTPGRYIEWRGAGQLFKACAFKLHTLRCHYPMEAEFAMFLDKQTDLKEFQWWSFATASVKLQVDALPRLSILRVQGGENIGIASQLISGSSLTHLSWKYDFHFSLCHLSLSGARLKSLEVDPLDVATLIPISTLFPELEYLAIVKYRSYIDVESWFLSDIAPQLKRLRAIDVGNINGTLKDDLAILSKLRLACISLVQVQIDSERYSLYEWDGMSESWKPRRPGRTLWDEFAEQDQS